MDELINQGAKILFAYGLAGVVILALSAAYWLTRKECDLVVRERVADLKAFVEIITAHTTALKEQNMEAATRTRALEAAAQAQHLAAAEQARHAKETERLRQSTDDLTKEMRELREELIKRGHLG
jgi:DNA anti-recombination protein RmuC